MCRNNGGKQTFCSHSTSSGVFFCFGIWVHASMRIITVLRKAMALIIHSLLVEINTTIYVPFHSNGIDSCLFECLFVSLIHFLFLIYFYIFSVANKVYSFNIIHSLKLILRFMLPSIAMALIHACP